MENALFYTFSTIAQTLATAFALLGAFVLFRIQQIAATLENTSRVVMQPYLPNEEARRLQTEGRFKELEAMLKGQVPQRRDLTDTHSFKAAYNAMTNHIKVELQLRLLFVTALILTVIVIAGAVLVLAATPYIAISRVISNVVFVVGIVAFLSCLTLYAILIWRVAK